MSTFADSFSKIGKTVADIVSAGIIGYSSVKITQAQVGYFDSMTALNNFQIDNAISTITEQEKAKELNKQLTSINGKMKNNIPLSKEEYEFMVSCGYDMNDYKLDENNNFVKVVSETSDNEMKLNGLSLKGYLTLGAIILGGIFILKKVF